MNIFIDYLMFIPKTVDVIGILILIIGGIKFVISYVDFELKGLKGLSCSKEIRRLRVQLGSYILVSLEFMIISDIIHSAVTRELNDLIYLGAIVLIRTMISFFLGKEIEHIQLTDN